jgi:signal transduction histidine kinase
MTMSGRRPLARIVRRGAELPRRTVRLRLTALYAALFLLSGAALLGITYGLVAQATSGCFVGAQAHGSAFTCGPQNRGQAGSAARAVTGGPVTTNSVGQTTSGGLTAKQQQELQAEQQAEKSSWDADELDTLLTRSGIALAIMAAGSIGLGWIVAGRVLRPLRTITVAAQRISATSLNQRLGLAGPDDEIKELGDTFDGLLARLEASFRSQRQFIANASHELRTPLTRQRLVSQLALDDPDASVETLRAAHERVLASGAHQEQLIEALLTLASGQAGLDRSEPIDLADVAAQVLHRRRLDASYPDLAIRAELSPARLTGDPRLAERMVANLIDNALHHNLAGGWVEVTATTRAGHAILTVANTGPEIPATEAGRLLRPFQRLGTDRTGHGRGLGLGLSIVQAIADTHGATLTVTPRPGGGLRVEVAFPDPAARRPSTTAPASPASAR